MVTCPVVHLRRFRSRLDHRAHSSCPAPAGFPLSACRPALPSGPATPVRTWSSIGSTLLTVICALRVRMRSARTNTPHAAFRRNARQRTSAEATIIHTSKCEYARRITSTHVNRAPPPIARKNAASPPTARRQCPLGRGRRSSVILPAAELARHCCRRPVP